jgi:site-specific DNA-cytosine methylase
MTATGHSNYSLSALDLQMVRAVPPGGNWKAIPVSIPSKRLEQIRLSGGRTTLYGRLRWDSPGYTITTYFNRPGNGCYIHPDQDRVITSLEAARIQSFPDSFKFVGSKTSRTKQIGNAVPPLLAYSVANQIHKMHPELKSTIDLFSGSGGLTLGFQWAGFQTIAANDFFLDAANTYQRNFPDVKYVFGDITDEKIKTQFSEFIDNSTPIDIVMGGPPCQGFSTAGKRMIDDPRNALYKEFVGIVDVVKPKLFVMENVEGILSLNNGETFSEIKETFRNLGYDVVGKKLVATNFGVPQKRKRVFIIGSRIGKASDLFPNSVVDEGHFLNIRDAIGDLLIPPTDGIDDEVQPLQANCLYQKLMQSLILPKDFLREIKIVQ